MTIRESLVKIIEHPETNADEKARLVMAYFYDLSLLEPGNGWLDDDEEMQEDLDRAWEALKEVLK